MGQLFSKKPAEPINYGVGSNVLAKITMEWPPTFLGRFPGLGESIFEPLGSETILKCYEASRAWKTHFDQREFDVLTTRLIREKTGCSVRQIKRTLLTTSLETLLFQLEEVFQKVDDWDPNMSFEMKMWMFDPEDPWKDSRCENYYLNRAVELGYIDVYELMVENMDNKNPSGEGMFRHCQGETPLHSAAKNGHVELSRIIMKDLSDKNPSGRFRALTPLHLAARYGHFDVCELILNQVDIKNPLAKSIVVDGGYRTSQVVLCYTPRDVANAHGHQDICSLIDNVIKRDGPGTPDVVPDDQIPDNW